MKTKDAQKIISQFNKETFLRFVKKVFIEEYRNDTESNIDSFYEIEGLTLPALAGIYRESVFSSSEIVYLLDFLPYQIFRRLNDIQIDYSIFEQCLIELKNRYPFPQCNHFNFIYGQVSGPGELYLLNNFWGHSRGDYEKYIFEKYEEILLEHFEMV
jgi:hypothetical protein